MTVRLSPTRQIELHGECPSEDAEALLRYLLADPAAAVDWSACEAAHTAVIQVLLTGAARAAGSSYGPRAADLGSTAADLRRRLIHLHSGLLVSLVTRRSAATMENHCDA